MNVIDDLQSSYAQFKIKQEAGKESKKKIKQIVQKFETLTRYYLFEAQSRIDPTKNQQRSQTNSSDQSNQEFIEAMSYFKKRSPVIVESFKSMLECVSPVQTEQYTLSDKNVKEPPQIVSHRTPEDQLDTEYSENNPNASGFNTAPQNMN